MANLFVFALHGRIQQIWSHFKSCQQLWNIKNVGSRKLPRFNEILRSGNVSKHCITITEFEATNWQICNRLNCRGYVNSPDNSVTVTILYGPFPYIRQTFEIRKFISSAGKSISSLVPVKFANFVCFCYLRKVKRRYHFSKCGMFGIWTIDSLKWNCHGKNHRSNLHLNKTSFENIY